MAEILLRVRLIGGDHTDVTYGEPDTVEAQTVIDRAISTLAADSGVLCCKHGDRLVALYARCVAAVEVAHSWRSPVTHRCRAGSLIIGRL